MRRALKEAAVLACGSGLGILSLIVSSSYVDFRGFGAISWGYPVAWHYEADLMPGGVSIFGFYLGSINFPALSEDLLFWLAIWVAVVETSSHVVFPYLRRLRIRHLERSDRPSLQYDHISGGPD